ncbi:MAG: acetamidase/formamidase family protein [Firmicutes bacterium]|nr:acetamidase/formamidase family protein [Bacillota bacterium]MCL5040704.1 acetamidase/formamidase family protein [Bacillota bacterium]
MQIVSKDKLIYSYSPNHAPVATVLPGEEFQVETHERFSRGEGLRDIATTKQDKVTAVTGPIQVEGARPGTFLRVDVEKIELTEDFGVILAIPGHGAFQDRIKTPSIKVVPFVKGTAQFSESIQIPLHPHVGRLATAPASGTWPTAAPGPFGGNMDNTHIREGSRVYLPVFVDGALLSLGDIHAAMGDGESNISGIETSGRVTLKCEIIEGLNITHPMVETAEEIMTTADAPTLDQAAEQALEAMRTFLEEKVGLTFNDACMLISVAANLRVCQIVNPTVGVKVILPKKVFPEGVFDFLGSWLAADTPRGASDATPRPRR